MHSAAEWKGMVGFWGSSRPVVASDQPLDLVDVSAAPFPYPRPLRINVAGPFPGSAVNGRFIATIGIGNFGVREREVQWNRSTGLGETIVYASSLRVRWEYLSGAPIPANVTAGAWATPCDDAGLTRGRPKPFGTLTPNTAGVVPPDFHARFGQSVAPAVFRVGGEARRFTIANYQPAGGTAYLYLKYGGLPSLAAGAEDFDFIVAPQATHIEEASELGVGGVWDAAGAGAALYNRYLD